MTSETIKQIWAIGTKECKGCGLMKGHFAKGYCNRCYTKHYHEGKKNE